MDLIPCRDAVDFLSKSAPRPWLRRMLLWMIFSSEIMAFFEEGRSVETVFAVSMLWGVVTPEMNDKEREAAIRGQYDEELANRLVSAAPKDEIQRVVFEWEKGSGPRHVSAGYFVHADEINWDEGRLRAEFESSDIFDEALFWEDDELLSGEYEKPVYNVTLRGLCFNREAIEMLQPSFQIPSAFSGQPTTAARLGRPRIWDWDAALTYLMSIAQTPDGLPTGTGSQAQIERLLADWFMAETGDTPAESQIRKHATKIMCGLKRPETS